MLNVNDPKNIERYVKETWKAEIKVPYDKDFVDDFQFSEYCNKITKKENKMYVIQAKAEKEARHDKHKRCLAMAMWCMARYNEWVAYYPTTTTRKMKFLDKWEKRWRTLADKYKEGNV